jgi:hypothetical protein
LFFIRLALVEIIIPIYNLFAVDFVIDGFLNGYSVVFQVKFDKAMEIAVPTIFHL